MSPETREELGKIQAALRQPGQRAPSLADAVEAAARMALDVVAGQDARRWLPGG